MGRELTLTATAGPAAAPGTSIAKLTAKTTSGTTLPTEDFTIAVKP